MAYAADSERMLTDIARDEALLLRTIADAARADGIPIDEISVGATPTARYSVAEPGVTELRPGTSAYYDRTQVAFGAATLGDCALTVLAMVVSKPAPDRVVLDCGSKTLSTDPPRAFGTTAGYGAVFTDLALSAVDDNLMIARLSEEHAVVTAISGTTPLVPHRKQKTGCIWFTRHLIKRYSGWHPAQETGL